MNVFFILKISSVILVATIVAVLLLRHARNNANAAFNSAEIEMLEPVTSVYDKNGQLSYALHAHRMEKQFQDETLYFKKPHLEYHRSPQKTWIIDADLGEARQNHNRVFHEFTLNSHVHLVQKDKTNHLDLFTSSLNYFPLENTIHSNSHVIIQNPFYEIQGTGFHVNLTEGAVTFNQHTRGKYYVSEANRH